MTPATKTSFPKGSVKAIVMATLVAGILDASAAMINYKINFPDGNSFKVWRYVASGVLGNATFSKDLVSMAILGLLFHFIIAFLFTLFFFYMYTKVKAAGKNLILSGILYGLFVWAVMNLIVVPFSNIPGSGKLWDLVNTNGKVHPVLQLPSNYKQFVISILFLMFCVGVPIAQIIGKYYSKKLK